MSVAQDGRWTPDVTTRDVRWHVTMVTMVTVAIAPAFVQRWLMLSIVAVVLKRSLLTCLDTLATNSS